MCLHSRLNLEKLVRKKTVGVALEYQIQTRLFGTRAMFEFAWLLVATG